MRSRLYIVLIMLAFLACSPLYACADKPFTCYYTLAASSPADDPTTGPIEARPGTAIAVNADVSGTYSGPIAITLPSFDVKLRYDLKRDGNVVDTKTDSYPVDPMRVEPGREYSRTGGRSYTIPSDITPGDYTLECTAEVSLFGMGRSEHASFPVKVTGGPLPDTPPASFGIQAPGPGSPSETSRDLVKLCAYPADLRQYVANGL